MTATPETLAAAARWRANAKKAQQTIYEEEVVAAEARNGELPKRELAEIAATKQRIEQAKIGIDSKTPEGVKQLEALEAAKREAEFQERLAKGTLTKDDAARVAAEKERQAAECEEKRAWLAKLG